MNTKIMLKNVLARHIPRALFERPKHGFESPIAHWLRGPLKQWAQDLLDPVSIRRDDLLDSELIEQKWLEHQAGNRNWQHTLWSVLMFQEWKRRWT